LQAIGLIFSVALHGALLAWAALEILGTSHLPEPASPTIEAELITIAEFTKLKQGDPESKKLEAKKAPEEKPQVTKKEAPKPKPPKPPPPPAAEEPPPKPPAPPKAETPPPQPDKIAEKIDASSPPAPAPPDKDAAARKKKAEIQRKYREKQRKEAERKRKLAEKKRREAEKKRKAAKKKKKQEDFTKRMAALLDKTPEERGSPRSGTSLESEYLGPVAGEREGSGDLLTAREADLLKGQISAQIKDCWRLPGGGGGIEVVPVRLSWRLKRDGELEGEPRVIGSSSDPTFRVAAEAAIRAVKCAAPFRLPSKSYEAWRHITEWNFDPRQML
jgi:colicin import membrane protein